MKLVRFATAGGSAVGAWLQDGDTPWVIDLSDFTQSELGADPSDLGAVLQAADQAATWLSAADTESVRRPAGEVHLLAPSGPSALIIGLGRNFLSHAREMGIASKETQEKGIAGLHGFVKSARSLTGSGSPIILPPEHDTRVDYEGEVGIVIGARCHRVSAREASSYIGGYVLLNDVSARDWTPMVRSAQTADDARLAWDLNTLGKQFPTFCPMGGPYLVTADEVGDYRQLSFETHVNGELRQSASLSDVACTPAEVISYYSEFYAFEAGDIVTTGTPAGVGTGMNPPQFLRPGDEVVISSLALGELRNVVQAAKESFDA